MPVFLGFPEFGTIFSLLDPRSEQSFVLFGHLELPLEFFVIELILVEIERLPFVVLHYLQFIDADLLCFLHPLQIFLELPLNLILRHPRRYVLNHQRKFRYRLRL